MYDPIKSERFQDLFAHPQVLAFARRVITESYVECAPGQETAMRDLLDRAFDMLIAGRDDDATFRSAVDALLTDVFKKQDPAFWFNRLYQDYKRHIKPQRRFQKLQPWLAGQRVLDLGCGNGMLSLIMAQHGYQVALTDVLDYRDEIAQALTFRPMTDAVTIPYPDEVFDTAIVLAVLHHVERGNLKPLLAELRRCSRRVIVEEDSYLVPERLEGLSQVLRRDAHLREFMALAPEDQLRFLMFIDYFANAITQGLPQMNMPFDFRTVEEWWATFEAQGFCVQETLVMGFQKGNFNRSCHVWFVLDAT